MLPDGSTEGDGAGPTENQPPAIEILKPSEAAVFPQEEVVRFEALLTDDRDAPAELTARWSSSVDGNLGISLVDDAGGTFLNVYDLSPGLHEVTILASDSTGLEGAADVTVVINAPPSVPGVQLEPASPLTTDELVATVSEIPTDLNRESDELSYNWEWYADGVLQAELDGPVVAPEYTARGQEWEVRVSAFDGHTNGPAGSAAVVVGNTPPDCPAAELSPGTGDTNTSFACSCPERLDPDEDEALDHCTFLDINTNTAIATVQADGGVCVLEPDEVVRGDVFYCEFTAADQGGDGTSGMSAEAVVVNAVPSEPQVALSPTLGSADDIFTCGLTVFAVDLDNDPLTYTTTWFVNDFMNPGVASLSVTPADLVSGPAMEAARRGDTLRCEINAHDGFEQSTTGSSQTVSLVNALPTSNGVLVSPSTVQEGGTITCSVDAPYDADGDPITWSYAWKVSGSLVAGVSVPVLGSEHFDRGDEVTCIATPHDGLAPGPSLSSSPVTVLNTAPTLDSVSLTPSEGPRSQTFTCVGGGLADVDPADQPELQFDWFVSHADGTATVLAGQTGGTMPAAAFAPGDQLTCKATPSDGVLEGDSQLSEPALVVNQPPALPEPTVTPNSGTVSEAYACSVELAEDGEGDPLSYECFWLVNDYPNECKFSQGQLASTTSALELVSDDAGTPARGGDAISCSVRATDSWDSSGWGQSAQLILANSPPEGGTAVVIPQSPGEGDTLSCAADGVIDLDGDEVTFSASWFVDGESVESEVDGTLTGVAFDKGQSVSCAATPHDGVDSGAAIDSAAVLVVNTAPSVESLSITPTSALRSESFTCSWNEWIELDLGDDQVANYTWFKMEDGVEVALSGTTGDTLWPTDLEPGTQVFCRMVPSDGESSGEPVDSDLATVTNHAPTLESAVLSHDGEASSGATGLDTLTCLPVGFQDGDGDEPVYVYAWLVDGALVEDAVESTLSGAFHEGNTVACQVTPSDGYGSGEPVTSNSMDIGNALPTLASVMVTPAGGAPCEVYTCETEGLHDPDPDDALSVTYEWEVNGESAGDDMATLTDVELAPGDTVLCRASVSDGTVGQDGEVIQSPIQTAEGVDIVNAAPTVTAVDVMPEVPAVGDMLTCEIMGWSDDGCDDSWSCHYSWMVDGSMAMGEQADTFDTGGLVVGTAISCTAVPYDVWTDGEPVMSAEITLGDGT